MKSYSSQKITNFRKGLLFISVFPIVSMFMVVGIFYISTQYRSDSSAQTSYRPPYDPLALFNQPIPNGYPSDPNSSAIVGRISSDWNRINFSHIGEVPPVYNVNNSMPSYRVTWNGGSTNFPVSSNVRVGGGSDYPLILLNTNTSVELRLWQATINHSNRTISGSGGGLFYYNNDGRILNPNGTRSASIPFQGYGTGSGLSYLAGLVTNEDFDSGVIRHALRFANSCSDSRATFRPPATRTDQPHPGCGATTYPNSPSSIEMGAILQLDKSIDCSARTVPGKANTSRETRLVRMVCKAMQDYGAIMLDGTGPGGGANFYLEDNLTAQWNLDDAGRGNYGWMFRPPYYSGDGISRGGNDGIPFNKLRVLARPASNISWGAGTPATPTPAPLPVPSPTPTPSPSPSSSTSTQSPYVSAGVPGTIEAENYDRGGQGVAYSDTEATNLGGKYRSDGVDIEQSSEGYSVGYVKPGEWLEFTTNVKESGKYDITFRVARSSTTQGTWQLKSNGTLLASATVSDTGGWYTWKDIKITGISLSAGTKVLRLEASGGGVNLNYIRFVKQGGSEISIPVPVQSPSLPSNPRPPIKVPGATSSAPVKIPDILPVEEDGSIIADFNGDGLNEVVRDLNADGYIDPGTEIVIDGSSNTSLTDSSSRPISPEEYAGLFDQDGESTQDSTVVIQAGPLPPVAIPKPIAYTFLIGSGVTIGGIGIYLAVMNLSAFAPLRGRMGL